MPISVMSAVSETIAFSSLGSNASRSSCMTSNMSLLNVLPPTFDALQSVAFHPL